MNYYMGNKFLLWLRGFVKFKSGEPQFVSFEVDLELHYGSFMIGLELF